MKDFILFLIKILIICLMTAFAYWVAYKISVSDLPDWFKFYLFK